MNGTPLSPGRKNIYLAVNRSQPVGGAHTKMPTLSAALMFTQIWKIHHCNIINVSLHRLSLPSVDLIESF